MGVNIVALVQRTIILLIIADVLLLVVGLLRYPTSLQEGGVPGITADIAILLLYGYIALVSPIRTSAANRRLLRLGFAVGLTGALALCVDLVSSYFVHRDATASAFWSLGTYGIFLLLLLITGIIGSAQTGRFISGVTAAVWAVLVALPVWFFCEFAAYYLFGTSGIGAEFMRQEMQADYARSGSSDYQGFVMADFFGAGFFHPLLMLILGILLGMAGAAIGKLIWSLFRRT